MLKKDNLLNMIQAAEDKNYSKFRESFNDEMINHLDIEFEKRSENIFTSTDSSE